MRSVRRATPDKPGAQRVNRSAAEGCSSISGTGSRPSGIAQSASLPAAHSRFFARSRPSGPVLVITSRANAAAPRRHRRRPPPPDISGNITRWHTALILNALRGTGDPGCDNDNVSPTPAHQARAAAIAAEITARLADVSFALPGTLADRMTRCGHPGCRCHADPPRLHGPYHQWTRKKDPGGLFATGRARCSIRAVLMAMILPAVVPSPRPGRRMGMSCRMQPAPWPEPDPQIAAAIKAMYGSRKTDRPLAVEIRDRLGQWLADEDFAVAFGIRGRPGWAPSRLALVTVLQRAEKLTDRLAAEAVRARLDWKYLLGLPLDDPGFDHTVLAEFRGKVAEAALEQVVLDALLERLVSAGLVKAGGKQRTDSTHVVAAVAALNRLELAGESVRAAVEALTAAHPDWVGQRICVPDWSRRYGTPMTAWRPPASQPKQDELAIAYARDGYALLEAVYGKSSPAWLRELPAVGVLRRVLLQNYTRTITAARAGGDQAAGEGA